MWWNGWYRGGRCSGTNGGSCGRWAAGGGRPAGGNNRGLDGPNGRIPESRP